MGTNSSSNVDDAASPNSRRSSGSGARPPAPTTPVNNAASPAAEATTAAAATGATAAPAVTSEAPVANTATTTSTLARPYSISERSRTQPSFPDTFQPSVTPLQDDSNANNSARGGTDVTRGRERQRETVEVPPPARCINPASEVNSRLDTQVEVRVYPCNNNQNGGKKKFTTFTIKPEVSYIHFKLVECQ